MKKTFVLFTVFLLTNLCMAQQKPMRFAEKSGHVEYELTGNTKGTKSIWWNDYGNSYREEENSKTVTKMFGISSESLTHTVSIGNGNYFWTTNLIDNTGQKGTNPLYTPITEIGKTMTVEEAKKLEKDVLDAFNGKRLTPETFKGYTCEVVEMMGTKVWVYKGILLKSTGSLMGVEINEVATTIELNITVPKTKFQPLANINYEDIDQYMKETE